MRSEILLNSLGFIAGILIVISPTQSLYFAQKILLFRVQCLKVCHLSLLRLKYSASLFILYAKWSKPLLHLRYLLLKRFIVHKWNRAK